MEKIDKFYEKINGSYLIFTGIGLSLLVILIAVILFIQVDPTFNMYSKFISDLGDGPNNSNIVFNTGIIISGIFNFFIYIYLTRFLQKKQGNEKLILLAFISAIISVIGTIMVGLFTSDTENTLHRTGAAMSFFGSFFLIIFFGIAEYKISDIPNKYSVPGFILAPISIVFLVFFLLLILNTGFSSEITIFTEWLAFFANTTWLFIQGIYTLREK